MITWYRERLARWSVVAQQWDTVNSERSVGYRRLLPSNRSKGTGTKGNVEIVEQTRYKNSPPARRQLPAPEYHSSPGTGIRKSMKGGTKFYDPESYESETASEGRGARRVEGSEVYDVESCLRSLIESCLSVCMFVPRRWPMPSSRPLHWRHRQPILGGPSTGEHTWHMTSTTKSAAWMSLWVVRSAVSLLLYLLEIVDI